METDFSPRDPRRRLILQELGFLEDPFTRTADPRFLYLSAGHGRILNGIQDAIELRRGLAVIEGAYGVGKSSVGRRLESIYRIQPNLFTVVYIHTAGYESEYAALTDISVALGLEPRRGLTKMWRQLEDFLLDESTQGRNVVILLDDAQLMEPGALTFVQKIYNFDAPKLGKLAQVVLIGQSDSPRDRDRLNNQLELPFREIDLSPNLGDLFKQRPEVASRVDVWHRLNPLTLEETFGLVSFRCITAGRKEPFITRQGLVRLWEFSNGVPRTIVAICTKAVDLMGETSVQVADEHIIQAAGAAHEETRAPKQPE